MALTDKLTAIANAIRSKTGKTDALLLDQMPDEILSIEGGGGFPYGGTNVQKIATYTESWKLADTSFEVGSSESTSATTILAATSNRFTNTTGSPTIAFNDNDIIVVQKCLATPTHEGGSEKAQQISYAYVYISYISKRKTTDTSAKTTRQVFNFGGYINKYFNTSGVVTRASGNYGMYMTPSAPTVPSATAASTYVRCTSPALLYRASSTYESTANIKLITDCDFKWTVEVYTADPFSTGSAQINADLDDMLINGLPDPVMPLMLGMFPDEPVDDGEADEE